MVWVVCPLHCRCHASHGTHLYLLTALKSPNFARANVCERPFFLLHSSGGVITNISWSMMFSHWLVMYCATHTYIYIHQHGGNSHTHLCTYELINFFEFYTLILNSLLDYLIRNPLGAVKFLVCIHSVHICSCLRIKYAIWECRYWIRMIWNHGHGHGHGHIQWQWVTVTRSRSGVFILATHPKGKWTTNPKQDACFWYVNTANPHVASTHAGTYLYTCITVTVTEYLFQQPWRILQEYEQPICIKVHAQASLLSMSVRAFSCCFSFRRRC